MVSINDTISSADFNNIQNVVDAVLNGSYGQTLLSSQVTGYQAVELFADSVTAENVKNLLLDLQKLHVHQQGTINTDIAAPLFGYVIGADEAKTFDIQTGDSQSTVEGQKMGFNDYISLLNIVSNFDGQADGFPVDNFSIGNTRSSSRATGWGGTTNVESIYHIFDVEFNDIAHMDYFFNAGGFIQFGATISNLSNSKDVEWNGILSSMGVGRFNKWGTTASSGTNLAGYQDLSSTYQEVFRKTGSGVYVSNIFTMEARRIDAENKIRFRITFSDGYTGFGDIDVSGTIESTVQAYYPDSSFIYDTVTYTAVLLDNPILSNIILLSENYSSPPS